MRFALILSLLIAIVAVVFAMYNMEATPVDLVYDQVTAPLALVIIVSLLAGVVAGILASVPSIFRRGAEVRRLRKRVEELEGAEPAPAVLPADERRAVDRPAPAPTREERAKARSRSEEPESDALGAAETQRLAAETQRMADEATRRAAEIERREKEDRK